MAQRAGAPSSKLAPARAAVVMAIFDFICFPGFKCYEGGTKTVASSCTPQGKRGGIARQWGESRIKCGILADCRARNLTTTATGELKAEARERAGAPPGPSEDGAAVWPERWLGQHGVLRGPCRRRRRRSRDGRPDRRARGAFPFSPS